MTRNSRIGAFSAPIRASALADIVVRHTYSKRLLLKSVIISPLAVVSIYTRSTRAASQRGPDISLKVHIAVDAGTFPPKCMLDKQLQQLGLGLGLISVTRVTVATRVTTAARARVTDALGLPWQPRLYYRWTVKTGDAG